MDSNDQQAIRDLFAKLAAAERQMPQRDAEADAYIRDQIGRQTGAPYYMAQTIIVQQQALQAAQRRIEEMETQARARSSDVGLLDSLVGDGRPARRSSGSVPPVGSARTLPQPAGGFLAGAPQTALGVAGGILLGNLMAGALGSGDAEAAEPESESPVEDAGFDGSGDFGEF
jgi:hypothetical protein